MVVVQMIRQLCFEEFAVLYKERICKDFPRFERRPLSAVGKLYHHGRYVCLVSEVAGKAEAYATFICDQASCSVLLDYYAVVPSMRGTGIGSRFLGLLPDYWPDKKGIILECEKPDSAKIQKEKSIRERRIGFYQRGGAQITPLCWRAFGVDYNILWLPIQCAQEHADIAGDLVRLYRLSLPAALAKLFIKIR